MCSLMYVYCAIIFSDAGEHFLAQIIFNLMVESADESMTTLGVITSEFLFLDPNGIFSPAGHKNGVRAQRGKRT